MYKKNYLWLAACCAFLFVLPNCISKSEHLRVKRALGTEIIDLRQRRDRNKKYTQRLERERKDFQVRLANLQKQHSAQSRRDQREIKELKQRLAQLQQRVGSLNSSLSKSGQLLKGKGKQLFDLQADLRKKQEEFQKKQEEFKKKNDDLLAALKRKEEEINKKQKNLAKSLAKVATLQKKIDGLQRVHKELTEKLKSLVQAGKLRIRMVRGMLVLQLPEKILFSSGRSQLKREGKRAIAKVTHVLRDMQYRWQVVGHTDSTGRARSNWRLSARRALAVLNVLIKEGLPPTQLSIAGYGQYQPTAPNDSPENRSLNRRTELVLIPDLTALYTMK